MGARRGERYGTVVCNLRSLIGQPLHPDIITLCAKLSRRQNNVSIMFLKSLTSKLCGKD